MSSQVHPLVLALPRMLLSGYNKITKRKPESLLQAIPDIKRLYLTTIDHRTGMRLAPIHPGFNALETKNVPVMLKKRREVKVINTPITVNKIKQQYSSIISVEGNSYRQALMQQAGNMGEEDKLVKYLYRQHYTNSDRNLHGTVICLDISFRDNTEQDLSKRTEGVLECALRSCTDTTGIEILTHNQFNGLKMNFGTRTISTEGCITTTRTRGLVEKHHNRREMIVAIGEQLRKILKQGQRLTVAVWDEDGYIADVLTLLLAEIGRVSWHGKVYIVNMYDQVSH